MKKLGFSVLTVSMVFWVCTAFAQCDKVVFDNASVLGARTAEVEQAAQQLTQLGADVRMWTVIHNDHPIDWVEHNTEVSCDSWRSPNGGRKSTLLVLMVVPSDHKMGVYYGAAWHKALDDHWNRIKQQSMAPRFHDGDFAGGFIAAANQFAARIKASQSEALTPATTINQQQPTDFSGLWRVLGWMLGIICIVLAVYFLYKLLTNRSAEQKEIDMEQQKAINAREEAMDRAQTAGGPAIEAYARVAGQVKNDPTVDGRSADEYRIIAQMYSRIALPVAPLGYKNPYVQKDIPVPDSTSVTKKKHHTKIDEPPTPVVTERVVERSSDDGITNFALGAVVGSELSRGEREDYREREDRDEERSASKRDEDDGGSSSYGGSRDDDSDSGGGGSSDYGSSDSGDGGSSDFSSDSGGGGSSDF